MKMFVFKRGKRIDFESELLDEEVRERLLEIKSNQFALSLAATHRWSPIQRDWAHYLAVAAPTVQPNCAICLPEIPRMLYAAVHAGIVNPQIRVAFDPRLQVKLKFNKRGDFVNVAQIDVYDIKKKTWLGKIDVQDNCKLMSRYSSDESDILAEILLRFNNSPLEMASLSGQVTGNCSFCGRLLTHENSVEVGYGPICATTFGYPHSYEQKRPEELSAHGSEEHILERNQS